jgi:hypothetical protein
MLELVIAVVLAAVYVSVAAVYTSHRVREREAREKETQAIH